VKTLNLETALSDALETAGHEYTQAINEIDSLTDAVSKSESVSGCSKSPGKHGTPKLTSHRCGKTGRGEEGFPVSDCARS